MDDNFEPYLDNDTRIRMKQYKNLREQFYILIELILGKDYYNMGMDVYTCDQLACEDILREYTDTRFDATFYHLALMVSLFVNLAFLAYVMIIL